MLFWEASVTLFSPCQTSKVTPIRLCPLEALWGGVSERDGPWGSVTPPPSVASWVSRKDPSEAAHLQTRCTQLWGRQAHLPPWTPSARTVRPQEVGRPLEKLWGPRLELPTAWALAPDPAMPVCTLPSPGQGSGGQAQLQVGPKCPSARALGHGGPSGSLQ